MDEDNISLTKKNFEENAIIGKKFVDSIQTKFKLFLKQYIEENPKLADEIKQVATELDVENQKRGPNATVMYYKSLSDDYSKFKTEFDSKIHQLKKLI